MPTIRFTHRWWKSPANASRKALRGLVFLPESRVMLDKSQWPVVFLGCILAGVVPAAANTLLTRQDFEFMPLDSRAQGLVVSPCPVAGY